MTNKIIIDNQADDLPMAHALELCHRVVENGHISNNGKQYAYLTVFKMKDGSEYGVHCFLNKQSQRLLVLKHGNTR